MGHKNISPLEQVAYYEWRMYYQNYLINYFAPRLHRNIFTDIANRSFSLATISCAITSLHRLFTSLTRLAHTTLTFFALPLYSLVKPTSARDKNSCYSLPF